MTNETTNETPMAHWDQLHALTETRDTAALQRFLASLEPTEAIRAMLRLSTEEQQRLVGMLAPTQAAELLEDLPDTHAADLIERLNVATAAHIVEELSSDHGADLLLELDEYDAQAILDEMLPEFAGKVRGLIGYPADVAGGLMATEIS
jgi:magnesium transporter